MSTTNSSERDARASRRTPELLMLLFASGVLLLGFGIVYDRLSPTLEEAQQGLDSGQIFSLNGLDEEKLTELGPRLDGGGFMSDAQDRELMLRQLEHYPEEEAWSFSNAPGKITRPFARFSAADGDFSNVGQLNTSGLDVPVSLADSVGGEYYSERAAASRRDIGLPDSSFSILRERLGQLPSKSGTGSKSITGTVETQEDEPVSDAYVALTSIPPFYADSLQAMSDVDTVASGVRGRTIRYTDDNGMRHTYALTDTIQTDAKGMFAWHGLNTDLGYTVLPLKQGLEFGGRKGTHKLSEEVEFAFKARPHTITLLDHDTFERAKRDLFVARTPEVFREGMLWILFLFFAPFFAASLFWSWMGIEGDQMLLPLAQLLCGIALLVQLGMPDPLRDLFLARGMVWGIAFGVFLMSLLPLIRLAHFRESIWRWIVQWIPPLSQPKVRSWWMQGYIWLFLALVLAGVMFVWGSGPAGSGAKVNLGPFQLSEFIKLLVVLFIASYFAQKADLIRSLRLDRFWRYIAIVAGGVFFTLLGYLILKDLGPALVLALTFFAVWGVAHGNWKPAAFGVVVAAVCFVLVYNASFAPGHERVASRVNMMLAPWNNAAAGGDHLAHSLWTLATGGWSGMGLGRGDAYFMPAAHTDMILSSVGEELGLIGVIVIFAIMGILLHRGLLIALRSGSTFGYFLGVGLVVATGVQTVLILGGAFGMLPLTGVSVPFMSYGKTVSIASFLVLGMLASLSAHSGSTEIQSYLSKQHQTTTAAVLVSFASILVIFSFRLFYVQHMAADDILTRPALVNQRTGLRGYTYNPRIGLLRRRLPSGTIYGRDGIPLATSDTGTLASSAESLATLGVSPENWSGGRQGEKRYYPLGDLTFYLLGDLNTRLMWGHNQVYQAEYEHRSKLRGYNTGLKRESVQSEVQRRFTPSHGKDTSYTKRKYDYSGLLPLLRSSQGGSTYQAFLEKDRDVQLTIDASLQQRVAEVVSHEAAGLPGDTIAVAALDAATGEVLASVTHPLPPASTAPDQVASNPGYFDHALYAKRSPGSTLKLATAMAGFRELGDDFRDVALGVREVRRVVEGEEEVVDPRDPEFPLRRDEPRGTVTLEEAIVESSNSYFRRVSTRLDLGPELLNLYDRFGIRVGDGSWDEQQMREAFREDYQVRYVAMGEGIVDTAPINMAHLFSVIPRGGTSVPLRYTRQVAGEQTPPGDPQRIIEADQAELLDRYLAQVGGDNLTEIGVAGKTGTPEATSGRNDGWYVGYAPMQERDSHLVLCVLVENLEPWEGGSANAGNLAYALFSEFHDADITEPR
jgi:cell division protein FtsW (lipid II flippase)